MKRFIFRLAALHRLRVRAEELAKEEYGKALRQEEMAIQARDEVIREMADVSLKRNSQMRNAFSAVYLAQIAMYLQQLELRLIEREKAVESARIQSKIALHKLLHAKKAVEILEKLRLKQKVAYDLYVKREEQKLLDELAIREIPSFHTLGRNDLF